MKWVKNFQLFLFDFDGLLVDTEPMHYQAYVNLLQSQGFDLTWDFNAFCRIAHKNSTALKEALYLEFPNLNQDWGFLYQKKKDLYLDLLNTAKVDLMPGVESLLQEIQNQKIRSCVVTNSIRDHVDPFKKQHSILETIPHWITRESYEKPKPDPECYLRAIQLYGQKGDRIIGFEDSLRGIRALEKTPAHPVFISQNNEPLNSEVFEKEVSHFSSFKEIPSNWQV